MRPRSCSFVASASVIRDGSPSMNSTRHVVQRALPPHAWSTSTFASCSIASTSRFPCGTSTCRILQLSVVARFVLSGSGVPGFRVPGWVPGSRSGSGSGSGSGFHVGFPVLPALDQRGTGPYPLRNPEPNLERGTRPPEPKHLHTAPAQNAPGRFQQAQHETRPAFRRREQRGVRHASCTRRRSDMCHRLILSVLSVLVAATATAAVAGESFTVDKAGSAVSFEVRHVTGPVPGAFTDFEGTVDFDPLCPAARRSSSALRRRASRPTTRSATPTFDPDDFFDVETYPEIVFTSTKVIAKGASTFDVRAADDAWRDPRHRAAGQPCRRLRRPGGGRVTFKTAVTLNRKDYKIIWNRALDTGGWVLADDVQVSITLQRCAQRGGVSGSDSESRCIIHYPLPITPSGIRARLRTAYPAPRLTVTESDPPVPPVPSPRDVSSLQADAADPAIRSVDADVIRAAGQDLAAEWRQHNRLPGERDGPGRSSRTSGRPARRVRARHGRTTGRP